MLNKFFTLSLSTFTVLFVTLFFSVGTFAQSLRYSDQEQANEGPETPADLVVINYDGSNSVAFATGFTYIGGARFRPEITGPFTGGELQFVQFFYSQAAAALTIKVYDAGTATEPGTLLVDQPIDLGTLTTNAWNQVELGTYVTITGNDLWICLEVDDANNFVYGADNGVGYDPDGDWVNALQGDGWQHLIDLAPPAHMWNIRGVVDDTLVPVELTSFTANVNNNGQVVLNWSTATELNNQMFEIERRSKESQFITIGYVEGYGTTTEPQEYFYLDNTVETGFYVYRLKQIDFGGQFEYSDEIEVEVNGPLTFGLEQNYPNPFNPSTNIKYSVPENGFVNLSVYNLVGEEVSVLVSGQVNAGFYEIEFDATALPSGIYFYQLQTGNFVEIKKLVLMK